MRYFWWIAIAMVSIGVICTLAGIVLKLDALVVLIGLMLAMSGAVKMVMLRTWRDMPAPPPKQSRSLLRRR